jgi:hypothetical protein
VLRRFACGAVPAPAPQNKKGHQNKTGQFNTPFLFFPLPPISLFIAQKHSRDARGRQPPPIISAADITQAGTGYRRRLASSPACGALPPAGSGRQRATLVAVDKRSKRDAYHVRITYCSPTAANRKQRIVNATIVYTRCYGVTRQQAAVRRNGHFQVEGPSPSNGVPVKVLFPASITA